MGSRSDQIVLKLTPDELRASSAAAGTDKDRSINHEAITSPAKPPHDISLKKGKGYRERGLPDGKSQNQLTDELRKQEPMVLEPDRRAWHRQPEESDKSWAAFCVYRDLPPQERTLTQAYFDFYGKDPDISAYNGSLFSAWAKRYRWHERVQQYDNHVDDQIRTELEARRLKARLSTADLGQRLREQAADALESLQAIIFTTEKVQQEDGTVKTVQVPKSNLSPREITDLAKTGVKLERLALGENDGDGSGRGGVNVNVAIANLTPQREQELRSRARKVIDAQDEVVDVTAQLLGIESDPDS
jgi:hypothetical protein